MLYENTLLKTFDNNYQYVLIRQEKLRKDIATMIYCFYTVNKSAINEYLKDYMLNSCIHDNKYWNREIGRLDTIPDGSNNVGMFTEKTVNIMPKIHIDLITKVLDLTCTIYNGGVDRYLLNKDGSVNEEQTALLLNIYNGFNAGRKLVDIYKQGYLFNALLNQVVYRNEKIDIDIITPNFASVESEEYNYLIPKIILIGKNVESEDVITYWSNTEHYYINEDNEKKAVGDNDKMINPYGELPFAVCRFNIASDFWGEPQQDLIENNIWIDVRESNLMFVEMFQGLGVGVGINLGKQGTLSISPNTIILSNKVKEGEIPPSLEFASTNAPLTELRDNLDYIYKKVGNSKGLSANTLSNEDVRQSGVAKIMDSQELMIKKDSHKEIMKTFEKELYEKIKLVNNYYSKDKLDENLIFAIDYKEDEPAVSVNDEIAITKFKLEKNLISIEQLAIRDNPDLSTEQVQELLKNNKIINDKYSVNLITENGTT
jgi:hypothetical protein